MWGLGTITCFMGLLWVFKEGCLWTHLASATRKRRSAPQPGMVAAEEGTGLIRTSCPHVQPKGGFSNPQKLTLRNTRLLQTWAAILSTVSLTSPTKDEKPVIIPTRISCEPETLPSASPLSQVTHSKTEFQGWQHAPSVQISLAWPSFLLHSLCFLILK